MTDVRHLVCPHCHKVNRVPADKLSSGGNCGACKQPLWPDQVLELTEQTFATHTGRSDLPVLVDFWASWCGPCKMIAPVLEEIADEYEGKLKVCKRNIDENEQTPPKFNIRGIPTLMLFKNGNVDATKVGALSKSQLAAFLDSNL